MSTSRRCGVILVALTTAVTIFTVPAAPQAPSAGTAAKFEVGARSKALYRIREQLARLNFPNDAVGETESVSGVLEVRSDGTFTGLSKLTVDLRTLKSDEERRDRFIQRNTLETDRYPVAEFVPRRHMGMPLPVPTAGSSTFQLIGDMTVHGVTSQTVWDVAATFAGDTVTAKATTRVNFGQFKLTIPRVFSVLSVDDDIRLELNLNLRRAAAR